MDAKNKISELLYKIPRSPSIAFELASLLISQGDPRGELMQLSYILLQQDESNPNHSETMIYRIQRLLNDGIVPLVPTVETCIGITFAYIPRFTTYDDYKHRRLLYISTTPITQLQWNKIMKFNPSYFDGENNPVECVTWIDCIEYCHRLSKATGLPIRLPTSKEWEYACRAGTTSEFYNGNGEVALAQAGWYERNSKDKTHPVAQKIPNAFGLYDMHGNVFEWTDTSCVIPDIHISAKILRGGSWGRPAQECKSSYYWCYPEDSTNFCIGFRVCFECDY